MMLVVAVFIAVASLLWVGLNAFGDLGSATGSSSHTNYLPGQIGLIVAGVLILLYTVG